MPPQLPPRPAPPRLHGGHTGPSWPWGMPASSALPASRSTPGGRDVRGALLGCRRLARARPALPTPPALLPPPLPRCVSCISSTVSPSDVT